MTTPPLRERREDLPLLADAFLREFARRHQRPVTRIAPDAMQLLVAGAWPGNVRQLQNTIENAVLLMVGDGPTLLKRGFSFVCVAEPTSFLEAALKSHVAALKSSRPSEGSSAAHVP